jgi:hypothetical protein
MPTIKENFEISGLLKSIYNEMEISPVGILKNYALNLVYSRIHKYEAENLHFEKKYSCKFAEFKQKIESMENEENFEWEDDLMDWEFVVENLKHWQKKVQELQSE